MNYSQIKRQFVHYLNVLKWVVKDYYRLEKGSFWLVQLLLGTSLSFGLLWLLGIITGLNILNDENYLVSLDMEFLSHFYSLPFYGWLFILTVIGLIGAGAAYLSIVLGVKSVIRYQVDLLSRLLQKVNNESDVGWFHFIKDDPLKKVTRTLKLGVLLTGLIVRRLVRMLIPIITFIVALVVLIKLDFKLLLSIIPLAILYVFVLYFINRNAARNQIKLISVSEKVNAKLKPIIENMFYRRQVFSDKTLDELEKADYVTFADLRYKRRFAEIHVVWLNSLFLVLGSAVIVVDYSINVNAMNINWMHLIMFLIALRYAASGLQEVSSSTVAFSRFLPETEMVYGLLHTNKPTNQTDKPAGVIGYLNVHIGKESLVPLLLKSDYTNSPCLSVSEFLSNKDNDPCSNCWVYSTQPVKFKQTVKANKALFDGIVIADGYSNEYFDDIDEFLATFKPKELLKSKKRSYDFEDEEY